MNWGRAVGLLPLPPRGCGLPPRVGLASVLLEAAQAAHKKRSRQSGARACGLGWRCKERDRPELQPQWEGARRGRQVPERRGGAEPGRVPDSRASPSDLPPLLQGLRGVDQQRRETGSVRQRAGGREGLDQDSLDRGPRASAGRRATQVPRASLRQRRACVQPRARRGLRKAACARVFFPPPLAPQGPSPPRSRPRLLCAVPAPAPSGPRLRLLRARDWPAGPLVGGAPGRPGALYSKGRARALSQFLGSWRARGGRAAVRLSVLPSDFLLPPLPVSAEVTGGGGRARARPQWQRERQLRLR